MDVHINMKIPIKNHPQGASMKTLPEIIRQCSTGTLDPRTSRIPVVEVACLSQEGCSPDFPERDPQSNSSKSDGLACGSAGQNRASEKLSRVNKSSSQGMASPSSHSLRSTESYSRTSIASRRLRVRLRTDPYNACKTVRDSFNLGSGSHTKVVFRESRHRTCREPLRKPMLASLPINMVGEGELLSRLGLLLLTDDRPVCKMDNFMIYDKKGRLCRIDDCMIEGGEQLYLAGDVIALHHDTDAAEGIACCDIGPIESWWLTGFHHEEKSTIVLSTARGDYYLVSGDADYVDFIRPLFRKVHLTKAIMVAVNNDFGCSYAKLVSIIRNASNIEEECKGFTEEELLQHAKFVLQQVCSFDDAADDADEHPLRTAPCLCRLAKLSHVTTSGPPTKRRRLTSADGRVPKGFAIRHRTTSCSSIAQSPVKTMQEIIAQESALPHSMRGARIPVVELERINGLDMASELDLPMEDLERSCDLHGSSVQDDQFQLTKKFNLRRKGESKLDNVSQLESSEGLPDKGGKARSRLGFSTLDSPSSKCHQQGSVADDMAPESAAASPTRIPQSSAHPGHIIKTVPEIIAQESLKADWAKMSKIPLVELEHCTELETAAGADLQEEILKNCCGLHHSITEAGQTLLTRWCKIRREVEGKLDEISQWGNKECLPSPEPSTLSRSANNPDPARMERMPVVELKRLDEAGTSFEVDLQDVRSESSSDSCHYEPDQASLGERRKVQRELGNRLNKSFGNDGGRPLVLQRTSSRHSDVSCHECLQPLYAVCLADFPRDSVNECDLLSRPEFSVSRCDRPVCRVSSFLVYDKNNHICPIDSGLIEKCKHLFLAGYAKPVCEDGDNRKGVACSNIGPISSWWLTGFNKGEVTTIGISTDQADYYLLHETPTYTDYIQGLRRKISLTKVVIEAVIHDPQCSYEKLAATVQNAKVEGQSKEGFVEDELIRNGRFILSQVCSYDAARDDMDEQSVLSAPCLQSLVNLCQMAKIKGNKSTELHGFTKARHSHAVCTPLVHKVFGAMFQHEMADSASSGTTSCHNYAICPCCSGWQLGDNGPVKTDNSMSHSIMHIKRRPDVKWTGKSQQTSACVFHSGFQLGKETVTCGSFVLAHHPKFSCPRVGQVMSLFEQDGSRTAHLQWFCTSSETVLGNVGDPHELFMVSECGDVAIAKVYQCCLVNKQILYEEWFLEGGKQKSSDHSEEGTYHFSKLYCHDTGRFEDVPLASRESGKLNYSCYSCCQRTKKEQAAFPVLGKEVSRATSDGSVSYLSVKWQKLYSVGDCVFLSPKTFSFGPSSKQGRKMHKPLGSMCEKACDPFQVGCIKAILKRRNSTDLVIEVLKFYRPEDLPFGSALSAAADLNVLYYSEEVASVSLSSIRGKAAVLFAPSPQSANQGVWSVADMFTFSTMYDALTKTFWAVPPEARKIGSKLKDREKQQMNNVRPLNTMEVFAGCGGLAYGMEAVGASKTLWAVENSAAASRAFQINFPETTVYTTDCNTFLGDVLKGEETNAEGQRLPKKGEVELLCGGPPCQGFSLLNRFRNNQKSKLKNSLVCTFLSYCEFFRPRFFVMENVRTFASVENGVIAQLTLMCLLRIGYQCCFGVLQAGNYGLPQNRKRFIILAAAPGEVLPKFPEPMTSFDSKMTSSVTIAKRKFHRGTTWSDHAPLRSLTLHDAILDLANVELGDSVERSMSLTHYQRLMAGSEEVPIRHHLTERLSPLDQARLDHIPKCPGANWRDLPDIVVRLRDGTYTEKLKFYNYGNFIEGVCPCAAGKWCDPSLQQTETLIPWRLVHLTSCNGTQAQRGYRLESAYQRHSWNMPLSTITTVMRPMGDQNNTGTIHPEENRVFTARECARIQGFPDNFTFSGSLSDKRIQIGNAVPPPIAAAIGRKIRESLQ